jgi:DNA-binding LytR/AlgR family response regulator
MKRLPGNAGTTMNTLKMNSAGHAASKRERAWDYFVDSTAQRSCAPVVTARYVPISEDISRSQSRTIAIKTDGWIHFITPTEIVVIEAQGNYVSLQCRSGSILLRKTISLVAEGLLPYGFVRIHRSVIVNVSCVEEIAPRVTGEYDLRLKNGKQYTVSKCYKTNLRLFADLWLGREFSLLTK